MYAQLSKFCVWLPISVGAIVPLLFSTTAGDCTAAFVASEMTRPVLPLTAEFPLAVRFFLRPLLLLLLLLYSWTAESL
jgi:hypothetical protein